MLFLALYSRVNNFIIEILNETIETDTIFALITENSFFYPVFEADAALTGDTCIIFPVVIVKRVLLEAGV
jgi:hypothetical protein